MRQLYRCPSFINICLLNSTWESVKRWEGIGCLNSCQAPKTFQFAWDISMSIQNSEFAVKTNKQTNKQDGVGQLKIVPNMWTGPTVLSLWCKDVPDINRKHFHLSMPLSALNEVSESQPDSYFYWQYRNVLSLWWKFSKKK